MVAIASTMTGVRRALCSKPLTLEMAKAAWEKQANPLRYVNEQARNTITLIIMINLGQRESLSLFFSFARQRTRCFCTLWIRCL